MKTKWGYLLTAAMMCVMLASAVGAEVEGDFTYVVLNGQATITAASTDISGDVVIPETLGGYPVTAIGSGAFNNRDSMTSLTIPDGVAIAEKAVYDCNALTAIDVSETNADYSTVDGVLFNKDKTTLIAYPAGKTDTEYVIPDGVTEVMGYAFYSCDKIKNVTIPDGVEAIPEYMFYGCDYLVSVSIPDGVISIGDSAFYICQSLSGVSIPSSVTSIGDFAFSSCKSLTGISIPNGVTSIGDSAFLGCSSLISISIPNSVTSIGYHAFCECYSLNSLFIQNSVTSIGRSAFSGCTNLTYAFIPASVTSINRNTFSYCPNLTIYGYANTYAQSFAAEQSIPFVALDEAAVPQFTSNLTSAEYAAGDTAILSVTASAADNGSLSYQWYVSDTPDGDGTPIDGATEASYTAPTDTVGVKYYYVIVTNTSETETGVKTATARSTAAAVTVIAKTDAESPVIFAQTHSSACRAGDDTALFVSASVSDGGALTYQWYVSDASGDDGDAIEGAVSAGYKPQTDEDGVKYYYVIITNTNPSATGAQTTSVRSEEMALTVGGGYITGDVDASGLTDSDDAAVLAQYFAGITLSNPDAADIDSDQALTRRDAMVLTRYLSGWKEYNTLIRYSVYE